MAASPSMLAGSDADMRALAVDVFAHHVQDGDRVVVRVRSDVDFEGQPALYITAVFPADVGLPMGEHRSRLQSDLGRALLSVGEVRFPYLRLLHESDEAELRAIDTDGSPDA